MLKGQRINLRTLRSKDLESFLELSSDIAGRGNFYPLIIPTETSIKARFEKDGFWSEDVGTMVIVDKDTDRLLGMVVFFKPGHYYDAVELGYILFDTAQRRKGITSEAVQMFMRYLFGLKHIHRIQLQIQPANIASRRVAEKCGFTYEGTSRHALICDGVPCDIDVFSILRSELPALEIP